MPYKDPEKTREVNRRWYARNREKQAAKHRQWHKSNRERSRELSRNYYASHKEKVLERTSQRTRGLQADEETAAWMKILRSDLCGYCLEPMEEFDHIDPISKGGEHHWVNLAATCERCNRSKYTKSILEHLLCL